MSDTMKAIRIHEFGDASVLTYEDAPRPELADEELLVRVHAAGVNPLDWGLRQGRNVWMIPDDPFPFILGTDVSGVVETVGKAVTDFDPGDAVFGWSGFPQSGSYAEYTATTAAQLTPKPASLTHTEAAGVPAVATTAWQALFEEATLTEGQRVLIHGAAGGVGHMAVQLAKWKGAHVIGTASGYNEGYLRYFGVDEFVNYRTERFESVVTDADVVLDTVGGDTQERSFEVLREGGVLVSIVSEPSKEQAADAGVERRMVTGRDPSLLPPIAELIDAGEVRPTISTQRPLAEAAHAHQESEERHTRGKIVLHVRQTESDQTLKILVVQGTLRNGRNSIHPARYVTDRFQENGHDAELFDMKNYDIPLFTNRRDMISDPHPAVEAFGQKVENADVIVIVTPEYNHSIPGSLKNLLDYLYPEYEDKPFSYITVTGGGFGGIRALSHLHDITLELNAHPGPNLPVSRVADVFDENSSLLDDAYENKFEEFMEQVVEHTLQFI